MNNGLTTTGKQHGMVNQQRNDEGLRELELFAGAGGGILGGLLLGHEIVCAVEYNAYARSVLLARQNDGTLPPFPVWDDVRTFDGRPWRGIVDVVSGGFPCQDISAAGAGTGIDGERSGLWGEMVRIIREIRPRFVRVENSPMLTSRGLGRVLGDLAALGFDAQWGVISAADTGAPHLRERIWIVANARGGRCSGEESGQVEQPWRAEAVGGSEAVAHTYGEQPYGRSASDEQTRRHESANGSTHLADAVREREQRIVTECPDAQERAGQEQRQARSRSDGFGRWPAESGLDRVANGVANRADRIKAIGNGQVPRVVATAWRLLA